MHQRSRLHARGMTLPYTVTDPELIAKLETMTSLEAARDEVQGRIDTLSDAVTDRRKQMREAFRAQSEVRFQGLDWKLALLGGLAIHKITVPGLAAFGLRVPTAAQRREIESFIRDTKVLVAPYEADVLASLVSVELIVDSKPPRDLAATALADRLIAVRNLPDLLLVRLADEISALSTYLSVVLEIELGNF